MMPTVRTASDKLIFLKLPSTASDVQALALAGQASGADAVVFAAQEPPYVPHELLHRPAPWQHGTD